MNKKFILVVLVVSLLVVVIGVACAQNSSNVRWEYIRVPEPNVDRMNELGAEGWEHTSGTTSNSTWFFKRSSQNVRWEYIRVPEPNVDRMNELGAERWEHTSGTTSNSTWFFKRRLP